LAFAVEPGQAWYVPLAHVDQDTEFSAEEALEALSPILADKARPKLGQHLKYDLNVLCQAGIELAGIRHDTMLESYVFHSTATRHDMDSLANRYLGRQTTSLRAGRRQGQATGHLSTRCRSARGFSLCRRGCRSHHGPAPELWPKLSAGGQSGSTKTLEIPLIPVLARMERTAWPWMPSS
jgi:DNA polymerase I